MSPDTFSSVPVLFLVFQYLQRAINAKIESYQVRYHFITLADRLTFSTKYCWLSTRRYSFIDSAQQQLPSN